MSAGLYAGRYRMDTLIAGEQFGGETAIGGAIENYPGYPSIDGFELMLKFKEQVDALGIPVVDAAVTSLERQDNHWLVGLSDDSSVLATAVILAIGRERRKLGLPHEVEWTGKGVSYCSTCDAPLNRGKTVAVVGGGSAAVEGAILNSRHAKQVYLLYRGDKLNRPEPVLVDLVNNQPNIEIRYRTNVVELLGTDEAGLTGVRLDHSHDGSDTLALDALFIEIGADPRTAIPTSAGVEINKETGEVHVDRTMHTNIPGIFAAGDLTDGSGALKQTITAAAQGAIAALSAYQYVTLGKLSG